MRRFRKMRKILLTTLLCIVLLVGGYAIYVLTAYYRLEDRLALPVEGKDSGTCAEAGHLMRAVSYNIGFGAYSADYTFFMDGGRESRARSSEAVYENIGGAVEAALALQGDFFFFQEVDVDGTRSHHIDQYQYVREKLGEGQTVFAQNYDSPYLLWPLLAPHGANRAGQVTASRHTITQAMRRSLPIEQGPMKLVDCDRCYSVSRVPVDNGRELVLYNLHLSAYTSDGQIAEDQLRMLCADMSAEYAKGNYALAGGDFNKDILGNSAEVFGTTGEEYTWAQPIPEQLIPPELDIVPPFQAEEPVPSCRNADRPYGPENYVVTVDGFLVSENIQVAAAGVEDTDFRWSDHNPVYLDFILLE